MNVNLELYKTFYVVAKYKHMTKASEELHVSQPAISQAIKKLEEELGGALFVRSNKGMDLTEEGEMFYSYVSGALKLINDAENEFGSFKRLTKGELKIGCSASLTKLVLLQALKEFHQDYPGIKINVVNELTSNLISDLKLGKLDFVIFNESNIKEEGLELRKLKELKMGFVYNPKYFEDKIDASPANPVFTKVWGKVVNETIITQITEESAFGEPVVKEVKKNKRDWVLTGMAVSPYEFDDETTMTAQELKDAIAEREVYKAELLQAQEAREAEKAKGNNAFTATSMAPANGGFNF